MVNVHFIETQEFFNPFYATRLFLYSLMFLGA